MAQTNRRSNLQSWRYRDDAKVALRKSGSVVFGASLMQPTVTQSTWSALIVGVATTGQFTWETLKGIGGLIGGLVNGVVSQFSTDPSVRKAGSDEVGKR